jgi:hypothetical protein
MTPPERPAGKRGAAAPFLAAAMVFVALWANLLAIVF